jgi:hypothetical protein
VAVFRVSPTLARRTGTITTTPRQSGGTVPSTIGAACRIGSAEPRLTAANRGTSGSVCDNLPTIAGLDDLTGLVTTSTEKDRLFVRWSAGPAVDLRQNEVSRDSLTGVPLPGLSANPLAVEHWWGDRSPRLWVARRLYDYRHLRHLRGPQVRPWVLLGEQCGRGPDNEPLVKVRRPIAWIADTALTEAEQMVDAQGSAEWGPLDRRGAR